MRRVYYFVYEIKDLVIEQLYSVDKRLLCGTKARS